MASTAAPNTNSTIQEPPKKKRKKEKSKYWLVKIPTWIAEEWFNDKKYQSGARLGDLYILPSKDGKGKKEMKLEITAPPPQRITNSNHNTSDLHDKNNPLKAFQDIPIPSSLKMDERDKRTRINVKHGELKTLGQDKLLVFHDKPTFPVGSKVEALDNSRNSHNQSAFNSDDEEDMINAFQND